MSGLSALWYMTCSHFVISNIHVGVDISSFFLDPVPGCEDKDKDEERCKNVRSLGLCDYGVVYDSCQKSCGYCGMSYFIYF